MFELFLTLRVWWTLLFWRPTQTSFGTLSRSANPSGETCLPFWLNWEINNPCQGSSCCPTVPLHSASGDNVFIKTGNKLRKTYSFVFLPPLLRWSPLASCWSSASPAVRRTMLSATSTTPPSAAWPSSSSSSTSSPLPLVGRIMIASLMFRKGRRGEKEDLISFYKSKIIGKIVNY